jgi:hypothetical protein
MPDELENEAAEYKWFRPLCAAYLWVKGRRGLGERSLELRLFEAVSGISVRKEE